MKELRQGNFEICCNNNINGGWDLKEYSNLRLWYNKPAQNNHYGWENESLPLGNGMMGCCIFGGVETERIQFNEKSLWTGGPANSRPDYRGGNKKDKSPYFKLIQEKLAEGKQEEALELIHQLEGAEEGYGSFQNFGDIYIEFVNSREQATDYIRDLDIGNAKASVSYTMGGVSYNREYFMSFPEHVFVARYTATGTNNLSFRIRVESAHEGATVPYTEELFKDISRPSTAASMLRGRLVDNDMLYEAIIQAYSHTGKVTNEPDGSIKITEANEVVIIMSAGTDYRCIYPTYRGEDPHNKVCSHIQDALQMDYDMLYKHHIKDYQDIFNRVSLELDNSNNYQGGIPTDELLALYKEDKRGKEDKYLEVLLFQFGRYLTIASSRDEEGALPSNLQGVWNDSNQPAWGSDYHLNINLQMNYWPAYVTNMNECVLPLIDYVESLRIPGRLTAEEYMGVKSSATKPENGFTAHTQNTIFGWTCPGWDFYWGWSPAAVPWIIQNIWEYYEFTMDKGILLERIYPIMKEEVTLYEQCLVWDKHSKRMVSSPSFSPEHGPVTVGNTYEQALIWQLYEDTIKAANTLDIDQELVGIWKDTRSKLEPIHIGTDGQIKEWYEETSLGSMELTEQNHRHISHLLGLYPGDLISYKTPDWLEAAKVSLLDRGDESTGWSMGHKLNAWARIRDGEHAYGLIRTLLKTCILNNLWDTHPPFQIDGNFAATSGITEMLLQSNQGVIDPLPALPSAWRDGKISGILARGGFEINISWINSKLTELDITSHSGSPCLIRMDASREYTVTEKNKGREIKFEKKEDIIHIDTGKNNRYIVTII